MAGKAGRTRRRRRAILLAAAVTAFASGAGPNGAGAADCTLPGPADATFTSQDTVTGEFDPSHEGSYAYLPFDVPAGTTAVRIRYCHDQPENVPPNPTPNSPKHVLDLGLYDARPDSATLWGEPQFRGWSGSNVRDVTVSPNGFTPDAVYDADRKAHVTGFTTRAYEPGSIPEGEWAAELGVAAVASQQEGDADGKVQWKLQIELSQSGVWSSSPYSPAPYDATPANPSPGWYAGDFHVHGEHEPGNATMRQTFDYAFAPYGPAGAGLDFVTLVDHNNVNAYGEIGRYQADYPGKLIVRSTEVTTYRGHLQNHASGDWADYRTGPLYVRQGDGSLVLARGPRPAHEVFDEIRAAGGFTQINHPTIFPSQVPTFDDFCRGCAWDYDPGETDYSKVSAIEIATGPAGVQAAPNPGPNPFTALAIRFWEDAIDAGGTNSIHIAAVGSSDSHQAIPRSQINPLTNLTDAPIGMATTVVFADELSEKGIQRGVEAGHTYVKMWGEDGPDLRLEARVPGSSDPPAIIGDTVEATQVEFTAAVKNLTEAMSARPGAYVLHVVRNGAPLFSVPIPPGQDEFEFAFPSVGPSRYRLQVDRTLAGVGSIEAVSSPIYHQSPQGAAPPPSAAITDVSAIEGDSGPRDASFTVSISDRAPGPVAVDYATADGAATAGGDYEARSGTVVFQPGDTSERVSIPLIGDTEDEPDETFSVAISNPAGVTIAKGEGTGTILDDDGADSRLGRCAQTQLGTENSEELIGTELSDRILGKGGADLILGRRGRDCLKGGTGDDRLVGGRSRDRISGGADRDVVRATGGGFDRVRCGAGVDKVFAGPGDALRGCERVR